MNTLSEADYHTCFFEYGFFIDEYYGFKKKHLYRLRTLERLNLTERGYHINKKYYTLAEIKQLIKQINQTVSLDRLQWWQQCDIIKGL